MSHEITDEDGLVLTGEPAWHGLGVVVEAAPSPERALQIAKLDWSVEKVPLIARRAVTAVGDEGVTETTKDLPVPGRVATVRSDTGRVLGVVGAGYSVIQNRDLVPLIYAAAAAEGVQIESAGSLRQGREVFFCARLASFNLGGRDLNHTYALFLNGHDGGQALMVMPTSVRVVCHNTKTAALTGAEEAKLTVRLRHTALAQQRLEDVRTCLRGAAAVAAREEEKARALAARRMTEAEVQAFFVTINERITGGAAVNSRGDGTCSKARATRAAARTADWVATLRREMVENGDGFPTAWLVANAATRWVDHVRGARATTDALHSKILGTKADLKAEIFEEAGALLE